MMKWYLFWFAVLSAVFVHVVQCETDLLDEGPVWGDDIEGTTEIDKSSTDVIERSLDLRPSDENRHSADESASKVFEQSLKNVDLRKLMQQDKITTRPFNESKNIQRVAKKMNIVDMAAQFEELAVSQNFTISDIGWLSRIFNLIMWNPERLPGFENVSVGCSSHLKQYLRALHNGTLWATKMSDATGRYTTQFFFGNDFWLGSKTMCLELKNKSYNKQAPPFPLHFFVSKFLLKMYEKTRLISIGLCVPKECSTEEVKHMLTVDAELTKSTYPERSLQVLSVRAVPGSYSLLADKKLHLLFTVLAAVIVLTIIGTCYEISLERRQHRWYKKHQASIMSNNNEGDMKIIAPLEKLSTLGMKMENEYRLKNSPDSDIDQPMYRGGESTLSQLILSFSAISNSRKILHVGPAPEESLTCVHGLRFLSLLWVIMVHTYLQVFTIAENKDLRTLAERNFMFQTVSNATFSVDTFFFISGLLVTYLYFKSARKDSEKGRRAANPTCMMNFQKFFKLVGYRYLRLTPAYMFVLLIAEISMRWIHNTSVFEPQSQNHVSCDKYWWRNILYINSLYPMKDMCMLWSWYVSNDTQFYVLGIIILLFSLKYFRFSAIMLFFFLFTSWAVTMAISLVYDYRARIDDPFLRFDELYDKPWTRLGPYLIGMCAGWYIFERKCVLNLSKFTVLISWFVSIFTLLSLVYGLHLYPLGAIGSSLYVSVGHTAWGVALAWIVIACCSGHGGFINAFLSYKLLHPLSRLTYCAYLVHPIIMTTTNFQMNAPLHLQDSIVVILYFGNTLASFISSFGISLLFEAPVVRLLKLVFSPPPKRKSNKNHQTNL